MKKAILASIGLTAVLALGTGCWWLLDSKKDVSRRYVRDSEGCRCPKGCACNHCSGEKDAKCYCGTGGCECAKKKGKCECKHCTGAPGGDDGKGGCTCP